MKSHDLPAVTCACGKRLDTASAEHEVAPSEGDVTICFYCGRTFQVVTASDGTLSLAPLPWSEVVVHMGGMPAELRLLKRARSRILARRPS